MAHTPSPTSEGHTAQTPLTGRRVAITGGSTGIGRATALLLAGEGAQVFICGRNPEHVADAISAVQTTGGSIDGLALDLAHDGAVDRFFAAAEQAMDGIDVVIINAAIGAEGLSEMDEASVREAIAIDFTAYLLSAWRAIASFGGRGGDIVLVGSMSAHVLGGHSTVYAGIKAGIAGFAEALRRELGNKNIRVGLVEPGLTGSDMQYPDIPAEKQREMIAQEKMLRAEDIAVGIHYFLTQPSRTIVQQLTIVPRVTDE